MTEQAIINRTTKDGRVIEIRVKANDHYQYYAYLDGKLHNKGLTTFGRPKLISGKSYAAAIGQIALTADELQTLRAAAKAADLATEEGQMKALRAERRQLLQAIRCAEGSVQDAKERAFGEDTGALWGAVTTAEAKLQEADNALRQWDAEHPAVVSQIKAEAEEERKAHQWD